MLLNNAKWFTSWAFHYYKISKLNLNTLNIYIYISRKLNFIKLNLVGKYYLMNHWSSLLKILSCRLLKLISFHIWCNIENIRLFCDVYENLIKLTHKITFKCYLQAMTTNNRKQTSEFILKTVGLQYERCLYILLSEYGKHQVHGFNYAVVHVFPHQWKADKLTRHSSMLNN